jgi:hypothetical protein
VLFGAFLWLIFLASVPRYSACSLLRLERGVKRHAMRFISLLILSCWLCTQAFIAVGQKPPPHAPRKKDDAEQKREALEEQRRAFAVSIIMSLTAEAAGYKDPALGARVLARAADALWDADPDTARILFRRAWEAAEKADWTEAVGPSDSSAPAMVIALPRRGAGDSRAEVLNLAARRDRALGDELLAKLIEAEKKAAQQATDQASRAVNDSWTTSDATSKRLSFAHRLLDENEPEKAFEFAAPALDQVNEKTISFLSRLRLVKPELADKHFLSLLARAEMDQAADANTVSGLSSYAFTPGLYLSFGSDGGVRWTPALDTIAPPNLPPEVRSRFFRTAANILLRPLATPDQDRTSAGLIGKYMVIKRLLPLFEQYAPVTAVALHSQLNALAEQASKSNVDSDDSLLTVGLHQEEADPRTVLDTLQERVDRAKDEGQRDEIYADAAAILAAQGNSAAQDIADKIDNVYRREMARRYVDISLVRAAIATKNGAAALRFAKADTLTHSQRTWAYLQIAQLLKSSDVTPAVELLEQALAEARRIDTDDASRPLLMIGVATQFLTIDQIRSWEVAAEGIKAANAVEAFSGETNNLSVPLFTSSGFKLIDLDTSSLNLSALVRSLAKQDLVRSTDLAKSLKYEAPRALAILAVASAAMEKTKGALREK